MIKPLFNHILVKPHMKRDEVELDSGLKLHLDTTIEVEKHFPTFGEVVELPRDTFFMIGSPLSLEFDVGIEVKPGDKVFFHYLMKELVETSGMVFKDQNDESLWLVPYDQIFFSIRNDKFIPVNGFILVELMEGNEYEDGILEMPNSVKNLKSTKFAKIVHAGESVKGFASEPMEVEYEDDMKEGDIIMYSTNSDLPIQSELYNDVYKDKKLYRMQRKDVVAVITEKLYKHVKFN
tara:strand:- start:2062 stop:2766 length:705 start_codon:yes stop_codon:yes gene_type:complete